MSNIIQFKKVERRSINQPFISPLELVTNILTPQRVNIKALVKETKEKLKEKGVKFRSSHQDLKKLKGNNFILFPDKKYVFILSTKSTYPIDHSWNIYSINVDKTTSASDIVNKILSELGDKVHGSTEETIC